MPDDSIFPPNVRQLDYLMYIVNIRRWCFEVASRDFQAPDARSPDNLGQITELADKIEDWVFRGEKVILK